MLEKEFGYKSFRRPMLRNKASTLVFLTLAQLAMIIFFAFNGRYDCTNEKTAQLYPSNYNFFIFINIFTILFKQLIKEQVCAHFKIYRCECYYKNKIWKQKKYFNGSVYLRFKVYAEREKERARWSIMKSYKSKNLITFKLW